MKASVVLLLSFFYVIAAFSTSEIETTSVNNYSVEHINGGINPAYRGIEITAHVKMKNCPLNRVHSTPILSQHLEHDVIYIFPQVSWVNGVTTELCDGFKYEEASIQLRFMNTISKVVLKNFEGPNGELCDKILWPEESRE